VQKCAAFFFGLWPRRGLKRQTARFISHQGRRKPDRSIQPHPASLQRRLEPIASLVFDWQTWWIPAYAGATVCLGRARLLLPPAASYALAASPTAAPPPHRPPVQTTVSRAAPPSLAGARPDHPASLQRRLEPIAPFVFDWQAWWVPACAGTTVCLEPVQRWRSMGVASEWHARRPQEHEGNYVRRSSGGWGLCRLSA